MSSKRILYWACQILGWGITFGLNLYARYLEKPESTDLHVANRFFLFFITAIGVTHIYKLIIIKYNWANKSIGKISLYSILSSILAAAILLVININLKNIIEQDEVLSQREVIGSFITLSIFCNIWSLFYFSYHFVDKSRKQEVKNLQLETSQKDSELTNLKNQLNPHFMFNAMNSIRALIDENPVQAKKSVTQLSNLLRNTLKLGQEKLIPISSELQIVQDYLTLEKVRFEERLEFETKVEDGLMDAMVPPFVIQTIAENAVKHGIGKIAKGGHILIEIFTNEKGICIKVTNDGKYQPGVNTLTDASTGIGLKNTAKRLRILFGDAGIISIRNENNKVISEIQIPHN
jgi:two-component system LytT family sensor kinase